MTDERNPLTGLYYDKIFLQKADEIIKSTEPADYCMVAVDIEHFRLFNKLYGRDAGDELLIYVADCILKICDTYNGAAGYFGGDNFGVLIPYKEELISGFLDSIFEGVKKWNKAVGFLPALGVYVVDDLSVPAMLMYDRATIAMNHVVGNYTKRICKYNADMEEKLEEELKILSEVQVALEKDEFTFFAQPQCDISTGKIVGAESLVRWQHSTKGMIPPGVFIPVLEKNGFIADLDRLVWRKVCEWLRSWIDRGYHPVPVSINVSRIDMISMDVPAYLNELLETYNLPAKFLKVEITESAYAESNDTIIKSVKQFQNAGFLVMMDDFGSGYSSLNMLKNVAVDVIKLDMRFLDIDEREEEKGVGILESVVNMARIMGLPIIVEGVETEKQESFLRNMGCRYTQGYYYYKPLPIEQFEELLADERRLDFAGFWCRQVEPIHVREFLDSNMFDDTMLNNILGPAAFYEMYENQIEITRVNEQYYKLAGISSGEEAAHGKVLWNNVRDDDRAVLFSIFEQAYENPSEGGKGYVHFLRADDTVLWVYLKVFFLREKEGRKLFYSSLVDMTSVHDKKEDICVSEQEVHEFSDKQKEHMEKYYGDMPCGFCVGKVILDETGQPEDYEMVYINREVEAFCGGNMQRLRQLTLRAFDSDIQKLLEKAYQAAYAGERVNHYIYSSVMGRYYQLTMYQFKYGYAACMFKDITHMHIYKDVLESIMLAYREVYFVHLQDNYCRMIYPDENHMLERGNYEAVVSRHFRNGKIVAGDEEEVRKFLSLDTLKEALRKQDTVECQYRRNSKNAPDEWCLNSVTVSERENGIPKTAIMVIRSIDALMREKEEKKRQKLSEALASMAEGFLIYRAVEDEKILYANPKALQIFGCETIEQFRELVHSSFRGMVHPDDLERVECEIQEQIAHSERKLDFIQYRIIRRDGEIRWIDDCGHLEKDSIGDGGGLFYVFISDITDSITEVQKEKLIHLNKYYGKS